MKSDMNGVEQESERKKENKKDEAMESESTAQWWNETKGNGRENIWARL